VRQPGKNEGTVIVLDNLAQLAEDLRKAGIDAEHDFMYGPHCCVEGLDIGDEFFPLWELSLPENQAALERADFAAILRSRGPDWTVDRHHRVHTAAG
jgi:hypothetical protein